MLLSEIQEQISYYGAVLLERLALLYALLDSKDIKVSLFGAVVEIKGHSVSVDRL